MNKIYQFRKILAESGIEMTPEEAKKMYKMTKSFVRRSKKMSMQRLWNLKDLELEGTTPEQIDEIIKLYQVAKEI